MAKTVLMIMLIVCVCARAEAQTQAQPPAEAAAQSDAEGIKKAALDYAEGWYEGNAERMERCLHPDLAKRIMRTVLHKDGITRFNSLDHMGALALVQATRTGYGKRTPKEEQQKDVIILDKFENAASVKLVMHGWIDYLHMARFQGRWVIVNVLWEMKPKPEQQN